MARSESFVVTSDERKLRDPHLVNLNEDQLLSGVIFHFLSQSSPVTIGRKDAKTLPSISLNGLR
jgi:kinesin family protein 1